MWTIDKRATDSAYWDIVWSRPYHNYEKHHQVFWKLIREKAKGRILDLGCGSASCWKGVDVDLTGIDYSPAGIKQAKLNCPKGNFLVGNINSIQLGEKYDTIVLCGVINYYRDLESLKDRLKELSHTGTLILVTINVIRDFPDREWVVERIEDEFNSLGKVRATFFEKIGFFVEIVQ